MPFVQWAREHGPSFGLPWPGQGRGAGALPVPAPRCVDQEGFREGCPGAGLGVPEGSGDGSGDHASDQADTMGGGGTEEGPQGVCPARPLGLRALAVARGCADL